MLLTDPQAFTLGEGADAVLLVHGFASTPAEMRPLAAPLAQSGLAVHGLLLPGHGESPEALETTPWTAWYEAVAAKVDALAHTHERVYGVGFSTGGALLLRVAALEPTRLRALVCLSAPVMLTGFGKLFPVIEKLGITRKLRFWPKPLRDIRDAAARRAYPSYRKLPLRAVGTLRDLLADVRGRLGDVHAPLLVVQSRRDHTVAHKNARLILEGVSSPVRESLILRESFHVITVDREREQVARSVVDFLDRQRAVEPTLCSSAVRGSTLLY